MSIYERLDREWHAGEQHIGDWFSRHARHAARTTPPGDTITPDHPAQPAPGATMSLASIAAEVRTAAESVGTAIENGTAGLRKLLDDHLPQIEALGELVDSNPVFASAQGAAHVPLEVLQGVAALLDKLAAAHPKPEPVPAADAPAEAQPEAA